MIHENSRRDPPKEAFESGLAVVKSYQARQPNSTKQMSLKWELPHLSFFKLNVDGALFFDLQKVGINYIIHNHQCKVIMIASIANNCVMSPKTIEAFAILRSLQLCMR